MRDNSDFFVTYLSPLKSKVCAAKTGFWIFFSKIRPLKCRCPGLGERDGAGVGRGISGISRGLPFG